MSTGGRVNFNTNQRLDSEDLTAVGGMALQTLTEVLVSQFRGVNDLNRPSPAVLYGLRVSVNSGLDLFVDAGICWVFTGNTNFEPTYALGVLDEQAEVLLDAHHATLPRFDIVTLAPGTEDDVPATRQVWDSGTSTFNATSLNTRRRLSGTATVTKGTAASSPTVPATPSGHVLLAVVYVPATSGDVDIRDMRPIPSLHYSLVAGMQNTPPHVPGTGNECLVSSATGAGVVVAGGVVCAQDRLTRCRGLFEHERLWGGNHSGSTLHPRYDVVTVDSAGTLALVVGTEGDASPAGVFGSAWPAIDRANKVPLAVCRVPVSGTDYDEILDVRPRNPGPQVMVVEASRPTGNNPTVTIQVRDEFGRAVNGPVRLQITAVDNDGFPATTGGVAPDVTGATTGSVKNLTGAGKKNAIVETDDSGLVVITTTYTAGTTFRWQIVPIVTKRAPASSSLHVDRPIVAGPAVLEFI